MSGQGYGQMHMQNKESLIAMCTGGSWNSGVRAGSRTVVLSDYPWRVLSSGGTRAACDAL